MKIVVKRQQGVNYWREVTADGKVIGHVHPLPETFGRMEWRFRFGEGDTARVVPFTSQASMKSWLQQVVNADYQIEIKKVEYD